MRQLLYVLALIVGFVAVSVSSSQAHWMGSGPRMLFEGEGGEGGGGGEPETVTFTKTEYEDEKKRIFNGGRKEAESKQAKRDRERLEKLRPHGVNAEAFDEALDELLVAFGQKGANKDEALKLYDEKIAGLTGKLGEKDKEILAEREKTNTYIVNAELGNAAAKLNAIDPTDAITVFRSTYDVGRVASGEIHVYDKSGEVVKNKDFNPATLEEVMAQMLEKKHYLVKTEQRGGSGGKTREGAPGVSFINRPASTWTEAEKQEAFKQHKEGKLSLRDLTGA